MIYYWLVSFVLFVKVCFLRSILFGSWNAGSSFIELPFILLLLGLLEAGIQNRKRWKWPVYWFADLLFSLAMFAMAVYFAYYGNLATYTSLLDIGQAKEIQDSIAALIEPRHWILFLDLPLLPFVFILCERARNIRIPGKMRTKYGFLFLFALAAILGYRIAEMEKAGMANELSKAEEIGVFAYQGYLAYAQATREYVPAEQIRRVYIERIKGVQPASDPQYFGAAEGKDIYMIQLEAFQNFVVGFEINGVEVTPRLNQLIAEGGFYFDRFFQQIAKGNTSDAEFVANTSFYPSDVQPVSKLYGDRIIPAMPRYVKEYGYESVTLHTNKVEFWHRDLMYPALGFDRYYDKSFFGEEDIVAFGASDEVLYDRSFEVFQDIKARGKKIYAHLVAMSSHHPFQLPQEKARFPLPAQLEDTMLGRYLQAVHYADAALGQFIDGLKARGWWDDALIVVYGDHFGLPDDLPAAEKELIARFLGLEQYDKVEMFKVPLVIRVPGLTESITVSRVGGQIDIMPTLANLIGMPMEGKVYFGQDLLNHKSNLIPQRVYLPGGSFVQDEVMYISGRTFMDGAVLPLERGAVSESLSKYEPCYEKALRLLELSDSYLHQLEKRSP